MEEFKLESANPTGEGIYNKDDVKDKAGKEIKSETVDSKDDIKDQASKDIKDGIVDIKSFDKDSAKETANDIVKDGSKQVEQFRTIMKLRDAGEIKGKDAEIFAKAIVDITTKTEGSLKELLNVDENKGKESELSKELSKVEDVSKLSDEQANKLSTDIIKLSEYPPFIKIRTLMENYALLPKEQQKKVGEIFLKVENELNEVCSKIIANKESKYANKEKDS